MTHQTDEELDALVELLRNHWLGPHDDARAAAAITALRTQLAEVQEELSRRVDMHECAMAERDDATLYGVEQKARADRAEAERDKAKEETKDAISTLESWFDRRELGHKAVDQAVVDAASGYLRTSRSGGMPQKKSDLVLAVFQDMARLGAFADLFARAAKTQVEAALAAQIEADAGICGKHSYSNNQYVSMRMIDAAREIRNQPHDRSALDRMLAEASEKALRKAIIEGMRIAIFTPIEQVPAAIDDAILALIEASNAPR